MDFEATLVLPKEKYLRHVKSIEPELSLPLGRSTIRLEESPGDFYIYISSPDIVSFKASLNSITRWLNISEKIQEEVD